MRIINLFIDGYVTARYVVLRVLQSRTLRNQRKMEYIHDPAFNALAQSALVELRNGESSTFYVMCAEEASRRRLDSYFFWEVYRSLSDRHEPLKRQVIFTVLKDFHTILTEDHFRIYRRKGASYSNKTEIEEIILTESLIGHYTSDEPMTIFALSRENIGNKLQTA